MPKTTFVLVGAGVAAGTAADTLRASGYDGRLVMIGSESDLPYNRPTLSKERLRSEFTDEQTFLHPANYYREKEIEMLLDRPVESVDVTDRCVRFTGGEVLAYDKVLIVTGARVRNLNAQGSNLSGIYYLRSLHDCRKLSEALQRRPRVLVVGTGFIGCEVAASARTVGCDVTLAGSKAPLAHVLGPEIGKFYEENHRAQGVDVRSGVNVERFEGSGSVERAVLSDGSSVSCDIAVIGIGVEPSLDVVRAQPVETSNGIVVDEYCQTSAPGVFAAGDVAYSWNPRYATHLRVEHFDNAQHQAVVAAKAMLAPTDPYNPIPSFWSDQYSLKLQYRGYAPHFDRIVIRGKPQDGSFSAFYLVDGKVEAICSVNRYKENYASRHLIGKVIDPKLLGDDELEVKTLASALQT